jgi:hypothetical protein
MQLSLLDLGAMCRRASDVRDYLIYIKMNLGYFAGKLAQNAPSLVAFSA